MPTALRLDFETRSTNNLPKCGLYNYADDTNTGVYMLGYKFDEEPTQVWVNDGSPFPAAIIDYVANGGDVWAFNAAFERQVWNQVLCQEHPHIPQLSIEQCFCTKAQGLANGLPSKLDNQAKALGVPIAKDKIGADLIRKYSILNVLWEDIPEADQDLFVKYCAKDVEVEKAVGSCCRELSAAEWEDYHNIERMNDRGIQVDLDFAEAALALADKVRQEVTGKVIALTGNVVTKITQRKSRDAWILPKLADYQLQTITNEKGNPSFDESSRRALCAYDDLDEGVRQYLALLEEAGGATIGKYEAMVRAEVEGKVYGAFTHNAAHTGRASSQLVQLQNMKRPVFSDDEAEALMDRVIAGDDKFDSVVETLALLVRHAIYEDDGMTAMDYSSVEYIVLMWLAGDQEAMDDYAAGVDAYVKLAAKIYHKAAEDVTKMERHTAKIVLLACIAEDSLVLTDVGLVPIQEVSCDMRVWSGSEFVKHEGVVYRGEKIIQEYQGVTATPDHIVFTEAGQMRFDEAARGGHNLLKSGDGGETIWLGEDYIARTEIHKTEAQRVLCSDRVHKLQDSTMDISEQFDSRKIEGLPTMLATDVTPLWVKKTFNRCKVALRKFKPSELSILWRSWYSVQFPFSDGCGVVDNNTSWFSRCQGETGGRPSGQQRSLRSGKSTLGDATGTDVKYKKVKVYDIVNCGEHNRFTVDDRLVHNCGFGGGVGAVKSMAVGYDVIISDDEAQGLVDGYRAANPYVKQLWDDIRCAIRDAVRTPETEFAICGGKVTYESDGTDLWCQLPSGRLLRYMNVNYEFVDPPWDGDPIPSVTYQNNSVLPKAGVPDWPRANLSHINGSENLTQAIANDLLRDAIAVCEEERMETFLMVHDELVVRGEHTQLMKEIMETTPVWADDMPLRADGRFSYIYGK